MQKLISRYLSLVIALPLFSSFLPASGSLLCPPSALAGSRDKDYVDEEDYKYQEEGEDGRSGYSGRDGKQGEDATVFADGSPVNLELSGTDGDDGRDGTDGYRPYCRRHRGRPKRNIHAADGGRGCNGGRGGDGGDGGSVMVYYSNLDELKRISVRAEGGQGGRGGRGGYGARGCRCYRRRWKYESCTGTPGTSDYKCKTKTYRCYSGSDGSNGVDGRDGREGNFGTLSIVKGNSKLAPENPTVEIAFSQLVGKTISLSKNRWISRSGARSPMVGATAPSLLAPGSIIDDEYREFDKRIEKDWKLVWERKNLSKTDTLTSKKVKLTLNDDEQIEVDFPKKVWIQGEVNNQGKFTQYIVKNAVHKDDVTKLAVADFSGTKNNTEFKLVDLARKSDILDTKFQLKYQVTDDSDPFSRDKEYEIDIPPEAVKRDYNRFTLNLSKLSIPQEILRPGIKAEVDLIVTRSLGKNSTKQKINWKGTIRKSL